MGSSLADRQPRTDRIQVRQIPSSPIPRAAGRSGRRGKSEEEEYYDEDIEEYYEGSSGRRGSRYGRRGSSYGRQRHQSARAMYYEDGDDNLDPPDYLYVERGHDEHRMIRDRQAEIDLMNRLYSNQRPNDWL